MVRHLRRNGIEVGRPRAAVDGEEGLGADLPAAEDQRSALRPTQWGARHHNGPIPSCREARRSDVVQQHRQLVPPPEPPSDGTCSES